MTTWYLYDNEDGTSGNSLPDSMNGPYYFFWNDPGIYRSDVIRGIYAECQTTDDLIAYLAEIYNPNGTYGTAFAEANKISVVAGTTYYVGGFFRFEKINDQLIWDTTDSFDKLCGMRGEGFRHIIDSGFNNTIIYSAGKLSFTASVAKGVVPSWPNADQLAPNVSPYSTTNPPYCDYSRWYAVVQGVTAYENANGRVRLWVNGELTTDYYGQTMETGATIWALEVNGTISQGSGGLAPAHKRQFDNIILTDDWAVLQAGGYLSDPEGGSSGNINLGTGAGVKLGTGVGMTLQ